MKKSLTDDRLKARIALEAIKGELTTAEMTSKYKVHANQISKWKKELIENAAVVFSKKKDPVVDELKKEKENLYKIVGKQTIELDWLKKKSIELGLL